MASHPTSRPPALTVGQRIRLFRQERDLTQTELARQIGIQQSDLSRMEKGEYRVPLDVLFRMVQTFKVSISDFFGEAGRSDRDPREREALQLFRRLPFEAQEEVLAFLQFKCSRMDAED